MKQENIAWAAVHPVVGFPVGMGGSLEDAFEDAKRRGVDVQYRTQLNYVGLKHPEAVADVRRALALKRHFPPPPPISDDLEEFCCG